MHPCSAQHRVSAQVVLVSNLLFGDVARSGSLRPGLDSESIFVGKSRDESAQVLAFQNGAGGEAPGCGKVLTDEELFAYCARENVIEAEGL